MPRGKNSKPEITSEQKKNWKTLLYDCSIDINMDIPREERINVDFIKRALITAIVMKFVSKHEDYDDVVGSLYGLVEKTLATTKRNWRMMPKNKNRSILKKQKGRAGHIVRGVACDDLPVVYDTISYKGEISNDFQGAGPVNIDITVKLFLSPAVYAGEVIYSNHNFPEESDKLSKNWIQEIVDDWCCELEPNQLRDKFTLADTWWWAYVGIEEYEDYWQTKRNRYATTSEDEGDDDEDSDDCREEPFFCPRKRRRRGNDCSIS